MPYTKKSDIATRKYKSEHIKRVPLDMQKTKYDEIKREADRLGESVNGYIKKAIDQRLDNHV